MIHMPRFTAKARRRRGQALVEFALALPLLLLLVFGIIEFGRFMQAWLALENGARFAVRYAVTGAYKPEYCDEAGKALGLGGLDAADGKVDCKVSAASTGLSDREAEEMTNALQDWARLPSIRDAAIAGATGIAAAFDDFTVAQDYLGYLSHPSPDFSTQYRGKPDRVGYFSISVCSSRKYDDGTPRFGFITPERLPAEYQPYLPICAELDESGNIKRFMDDPGGPGDRVRVTLTYRHNLITPLPNIAHLWDPNADVWWRGFLISASREGIVENVRVSRVAGLAGAIGMAATYTFTPLPADTLASTPTAYAQAGTTLKADKTVETRWPKGGDGSTFIVFGQICVQNGGDRPTVGLRIVDQVEVKSKQGEWQALKGATLEISPSAQLGPGEGRCFDYELSVPYLPKTAYRNTARVTILNHSGWLPGGEKCPGPDPCPFGPEPKVSFSPPNTPPH